MAELTLPVSKPEETKHLNIMVYGLTGAGKTTLLGTATEVAAMTPMLVVDVEGGTLSLAGKDVDIVRPQNWKEMQEIYTFLRESNHKYKAVAIDSVTEVQQKLSLGTITGEVNDEGAFKDLGKAVARQRDDWQLTGIQMNRFLRAFRDLTYLPNEDRRLHVILNALEREPKDNSPMVCPLMSGALGPGAGAFVDILGRLSVIPVEDEETGETSEKRYLLLDRYQDRKGITFLAKNRGGRLGQGMWEPSFGKILGAWADE
jgi:Zn-finger domain-containing protein